MRQTHFFDEAVLTCDFYIDLNQLRAEMADALEDCRHSAIRLRILAAKEREARDSYDDVLTRGPDARGEFSLLQAQLLFADYQSFADRGRRTAADHPEAGATPLLDAGQAT